MGLFQKVFGNRQAYTKALSTFRTLTAYQPVWYSRNGCIYESELIRASIHAKAKHCSKLAPNISGSANPKLANALNKRPNPLETWSQFLYRTETILEVQNSAFIVPFYDATGINIIGIYTVLPSRCELLESNGTIYLRYRFSTGDCAAVEYNKVGVLTKFQYKDDFFGESNSALDVTLDLIDLQNQGFQNAVKNGATFRFMAQSNNFAKSTDMTNERHRFNKQTFQSDEEGGLLLFPNTYSNIQQLKNDSFTINAAQMNIINMNVFRYFGVNDKILMNEATGDEWSSFYEGEIETFGVQFSQVVTDMLWSDLERSYGAGITLAADTVQFMSFNDKLNYTTQLFDRGIINTDESRAVWHMTELPNGMGQDYNIRGEYKSTNDLNNGPGTEEAEPDDQKETEDPDKEDIEDGNNTKN